MSPLAPPSIPHRSRSTAGPARRVSRRRGWLLLLPLALATAGCATKGDVRTLTEEIRLQNQARAQELQELRTEQVRLEALIRNLSQAEDERQALLLRRLREIQEEVELVREVAGASQAGLAAVRDQLSRGPAGGGAFGGRPGGGFTEDDMTSGEVDDLYAEALTAHGRGSLAAARIGFQEIVDRFSSHPLAPDARYYLADILAQEGSRDEALRRFLQVAELHPQAPRVPEALYRAGLLHRDMGRPEEARALFTRIVNTWPDTEVAQMARAFLGGTPRR
jgi:TolA-binding protein